jgi:S-adenosylmethionine:tRNA ribosyltransferase-isomerase
MKKTNAATFHHVERRRTTRMSELDQYDYRLPKELIAQQPLTHRSDARLMIVRRQEGVIQHAHVRDLPAVLGPSDALVLNDTQVVPARLVGRRQDTGGRWTGLFIESNEKGHWKVLGKTRGQLRPGVVIMLEDRNARPCYQLHLTANLGDGCWVAKPDPPGDSLTLLRQVGRVPLPPYIHGGEMCDADVEQYQTVFARHPGAIAAPTAGLHFSEPLLNEIAAAGVTLSRVTLHVGIGTFRPISVERLEQHKMHGEWGTVDQDTVTQLKACRDAGGRIVGVGTTSMRLLETAARAGELRPWTGVTDLFIRPPFAFHTVDALMTNFHLPRSTLLVLVRTFGGDTLMKRAYEVAVEEKYRFYSYGDAMLIL